MPLCNGSQCRTWTCNLWIASPLPCQQCHHATPYFTYICILYVILTFHNHMTMSTVGLVPSSPVIYQYYQIYIVQRLAGITVKNRVNMMSQNIWESCMAIHARGMPSYDLNDQFSPSFFCILKQYGRLATCELLIIAYRSPMPATTHHTQKQVYTEMDRMWDYDIWSTSNIQCPIASDQTASPETLLDLVHGVGTARSRAPISDS